MSRHNRSAEIAIGGLALLVIAAIAAWNSHRNAGEYFEIAHPTDYGGARICIDHGYPWYAPEEHGVRCYSRERSGAWDAQATIVSWSEGER